MVEYGGMSWDEMAQAGGQPPAGAPATQQPPRQSPTPPAPRGPEPDEGSPDGYGYEGGDYGYEADTPESNEPQELTPEEKREQELAYYRSRVGTPEDVANVKSQRDQALAQLRQLQEQSATTQAQVQALQQQAAYAQQLEAQMVAMQAQQLPPDQRQAFLQNYQNTLYQRQQQAEAQSIAAQRQQIQNYEAAQQAEGVVNRMKDAYRVACQTVGGDVQRLDLSTPQTAEQSLAAELKRVQTERAQRGGPRRTPPGAPPPRGGAPRRQDVDGFFDNHDQGELNALIERARMGGLRVEDFAGR